ncbi:MAG: LytB protein [SAR86 cluster bacterium]|uniref:LytB protein n=1 Tax=SAR86 cluster bacterium TaxID=2030880 RepID=A0A368BQZ3_9GAMM|nr:LytB protein [Gammaproteobacteria bacterium]RCL39106.1 MAG: LytB protein [SAR86 cluster bacterium]|tara:strand:- start:107 stop:742 length:636 start_codon:yes stop_codon:yes gene_type:complete
MIANYRYLQASLFSFCIHAALFLYIYGTFDTNTSQTLLISKPLQIELKFDLPTQDKKKLIPAAAKVAETSVEKIPQENVYSKVNDSIRTKESNALIESSIANLLSEESETEMNKEQQEISMYAQKIISTIESAWMKPRNIPEDLVANLRLKIRSSGRIVEVDLIKSSGNLRFDNSSMQAVRRVETFNFFNSMPKTIYENEFQTVAISFNPS